MPAFPDSFTGLPFQTIRVAKRLFMPAAPEMTPARLKWLRKRVHRVKLTTLAKESGKSFLELSRIEQKKTEAPKELLQKLAEAARKSAQN